MGIHQAIVLAQQPARIGSERSWTGIQRFPRVVRLLSDRSGSPAIWTMDVDGGNPVMAAKAFGDTVPHISPDGKWIVYTAVTPGRWKNLWLVASKGGKPIELNRNLWVRPVFSPDGKRI